MYRGPAHQKCNLQFQKSHKLPVVFHNLCNYDAHLLITDVVKNITGTTSVLAHNTEKYIGINKFVKGTKVKLQFIDSFKFMATSLEKLAGNLKTLKILSSQFKNIDGNQISLLKIKGVFPYDYVSSWETLNEKALPTIDNFFNNMNMDDISEKDYAHANNVWKSFKINTLGMNKKKNNNLIVKINIFLFFFTGEYSDLYLKTDVLPLADVFECFHDTCLQHYGLEPLLYYTWFIMGRDAKIYQHRIGLNNGR